MDCGHERSIRSTCQHEPKMKLLLILTLANMASAMSYFKVIKGEIPRQGNTESNYRATFSWMKSHCMKSDNSCKYGFYCLGSQEPCFTSNEQYWTEDFIGHSGSTTYLKIQVCNDLLNLCFSHRLLTPKQFLLGSSYCWNGQPRHLHGPH